jgi:hypothetical protein
MAFLISLPDTLERYVQSRIIIGRMTLKKCYERVSNMTLYNVSIYLYITHLLCHYISYNDKNFNSIFVYYYFKKRHNKHVIQQKIVSLY